MLETTTAPSGSSSTTLFYPGKIKMDQCFGAAPLTARAREIAKSREELLGLLHGLPEAEFELSLTDLVESSTEDRQPEGINVINQQERRPVKERIKKARKSSSSSSFERSSSSGVLLNMYVPASLTRSLTSSSGSRRSSAGPKDDAADHFTKRDTKVPILFSCWSTIWYRKSDKSRRRKAA